MRESDLYAPVKAYLEDQGYEVKAEVGDCDVLACRENEPPIVIEMKLKFSLVLLLQGVDRQKIFDAVYLALPSSPSWKGRLPKILHLCRRLGLGLIEVRVGSRAKVVPHLDPGSYLPRKNTRRAARLLKEFSKRVGDPNVGGTTGVKRVTAYRQDIIRCARYLAEYGPTKASVLKTDTGVERAARMLADNHYNCFDRVKRGVYTLSPRGLTELKAYRDLASPTEHQTSFKILCDRYRIINNSWGIADDNSRGGI